MRYPKFYAVIKSRSYNYTLSTVARHSTDNHQAVQHEIYVQWTNIVDVIVAVCRMLIIIWKHAHNSVIFLVLISNLNHRSYKILYCSCTATYYYKLIFFHVLLAYILLMPDNDNHGNDNVPHLNVDKWLTPSRNCAIRRSCCLPVYGQIIWALRFSNIFQTAMCKGTSFPTFWFISITLLTLLVVILGYSCSRIPFPYYFALL